MDRVKTESDVFTLKYFAKFINSMNFDAVSVLDPHSYVSEALIDRILVQRPTPYIMEAIESYISDDGRYAKLSVYLDDGEVDITEMRIGNIYR